MQFILKLLSEAQKYGITSIDLNRLDDLREQINMRKREDYLSRHKYTIKQAADGRWRTYLPDKNGHRGKEIRKATEEELKRFLVKFYKEKERAESLTFKQCYEEWAEYHHRKNNNSDNTRYKYKTDYSRFIEGTEFESMPIYEISDITIDEFLIDTIYENGHLTYKAFGRLYGYLAGTFKRAKRLRHIDDNPMEYLEKRDYFGTCRKAKLKTAKSELVSDEHYDLLLEQLYIDMKKRPDYYPTYAVELGALTGMRVAELAALKWEDVDLEEGVIYIQRSDKYNRVTGEWYIADETKTGKDRQFPIDDIIRRSLKRLKKAQMKNGQISEWLFPHSEYGWTHSNIISSCLKNKCKQLGLNRSYGIHAFRKTLNSNMRSAGASGILCSGMMGNSVEVNNQYYTYDTSNMEEKRLEVAKAHKKRNFR